MPLLILIAGIVLRLALVILSLLFIQPRWLFSWLGRRSPGVVFFAKTRQPIVALTIDDGPDPVTTALILAVLEKHQAQATFFLVSDRVPRNEAVVEQILQGGHEIGNHLKDEVPSIRLPPDQFALALSNSHQILSRFGELRWFRPGSGWYNREMLARAREFGYECALGSLYPFDAQIASKGFSKLHISLNLSPGSILILHDRGKRGRRTAAVLDDLLPHLKRRGFCVTTLSGLLEQSARGR